MAFGATDPARLEGDELTRWYLRSPAEIEDEKRERAEQAYNAFFNQPLPEQDSNSSGDGGSSNSVPTVMQMAANSGDRQKKNDCIEQCTDLALPTHNYGADFWRCMHQCMGVEDYPEWRRYFPPSKMTPPTSPAPHESPIPSRPPTTGTDNMFPWLANPPSGPWWLPLALPPYVPNS